MTRLDQIAKWTGPVMMAGLLTVILVGAISSRDQELNTARLCANKISAVDMLYIDGSFCVEIAFDDGSDNTFCAPKG